MTKSLVWPALAAYLAWASVVATSTPEMSVRWHAGALYACLDKALYFALALRRCVGLVGLLEFMGASGGRAFATQTLPISPVRWSRPPLHYCHECADMLAPALRLRMLAALDKLQFVFFQQRISCSYLVWSAET